ncbi:glycine--tRNA ligase [Candidatus Woesearchaeota archaeon]|nr:glycine--tRNA ligase [Candidatus Woesearchaeota archaeon]
MKGQEKSEKILNIATKRGFFFPTAEIYGAKAGFWTYGHLGTLMKQKWENLWRCYFLGLSDDYWEIEGSSILPEKVFQSSGHLTHFHDPLVECKKCHQRFRADDLIEDELNVKTYGLDAEALDKLIRDNNLACLNCKAKDFDQVKWFNMMFQMQLGATKTEPVYLSPETAQNPYLSFKREFMALREQLPFGLAMIGKAFRNEISPRQGFFRLREFWQAELQIFFDPATINQCDEWRNVEKYKLLLSFSEKGKNGAVKEVSCEEANKKYQLSKLYVYHLAKIQQFYLEKLQIPKAKFRFRELSSDERAFYNKIHYDVELDCETLGGFKEVGGLHLRGSYDLEGHQKGSGEKLEILVDGKKILPHVLELSFGIDRNIWALLDIFFRAEKERDLLSLPAVVAPIQVAVFPLVNKDGLPEKAKEVYDLVHEHFYTLYDQKGSIGKMYRRVDEIGTPYMITLDYDSLKDNDVTVRDRDSMKQVRVKIKDLVSYLQKLF